MSVDSEVTDLGSIAEVTLKFFNSRKNLDTVEVIAVTPMLRIHDQSCGEAEHKALNYVSHSPFPRLPLAVAPGETVEWRVQLKKFEVYNAHRKLRDAALIRTWGQVRFDAMTREEEQARAVRMRSSTIGRLSRLLFAIDDESPSLSMLVATRQDGEQQTRSFRPWERPLLVKLRSAWTIPEPSSAT